MSDPGERRAYTVIEAAALLGVSRSTMYQLVHAGDIRSLRLGRRLVIPASALEELGFGRSLASSERPPAESSRTRALTSQEARIELLESASKTAEALSRYLSLLAEEEKTKDNRRGW